MNRNWKVTLGIAGLALALFAVGCGGKKKPATPQQTEVPAPVVEQPTTPVTPAPEPDTGMDQTPIWDAELDSINRHVYQQGLVGDVLFDFDKYELRASARDQLAKNAQFMREHPEFVFSIEGHCDERGTNDYNLALGDRRAAAARGYLTSLGVAANRLNTISYGEERPSCTVSSEDCWQQNRRAHFVIVGRANAG